MDYDAFLEEDRWNQPDDDEIQFCSK